MSAFEIDITRNLALERNPILLPDKNKLKAFQLRDTADFHLNRAGEIHCQLFPEANIIKLMQQNRACEFLGENNFMYFLPFNKT